jgi:hypothetical protein
MEKEGWIGLIRLPWKFVLSLVNLVLPWLKICRSKMIGVKAASVLNNQACCQSSTNLECILLIQLLDGQSKPHKRKR